VPRILVVDDDEDIRLLLRYELSPEGHEVLEAANGEEALALLAAQPVDLVLLDIMMPVLDGWDVLRRVEPESAPPIVVITALSSDSDRHVGELLELGALDVIAKPFTPDWLLRLVEAVLLVDPVERAEYRRRRLAHARREG
jgi:DNA-binding response OmpR family regulator